MTGAQDLRCSSTVLPPSRPTAPILPDLGYHESESYGVSYKARGLCKTLINLDIFDDDQPFDYGVYGDITTSELHHNVSPANFFHMQKLQNEFGGKQPALMLVKITGNIFDVFYVNKNI